MILDTKAQNSVPELKSAITLGTSGIRETNINGSSKGYFSHSNSAKLAKKEPDYNIDKSNKIMNKDDKESLKLGNVDRNKKNIFNITNNSVTENASNPQKNLEKQQNEFTPKLKSMILSTSATKYALFRQLIFNPSISKKTLDGHINNTKQGVKYSLALKLPSIHSLKSKEIMLSTPEKGSFSDSI